jgi:transposase
MNGRRTKRSKSGRSTPRDEGSDPGGSRQQPIEQLEAEVERLRRELNDAKKQIADLERQLALRQQNSTTSSKPPSSDGLAGRQRERGRRKKSRRKPGGQPGHPGHCRPLVPVERVKERVDVFPDACRHCHHALPARGRVVTGEPRRHQVTELPPIDAYVIEYQCAQVVCPACGKTTLCSASCALARATAASRTVVVARWP